MGICCGTNEKTRVLNEIKSDISNQFIVVYSKVGCPKCLRIKSLLHSIRAEPKIIEVSGLTMKTVLKEMTLQKSLPFVFIKGEFIESRKLEAEIKKGTIQNLIKNNSVLNSIQSSN